MENNRGWTERAPREELEDCLRQALMGPRSSWVAGIADAILSEFLIAKVPPMKRVIVSGFTSNGPMVQINNEPPVELEPARLGGVPWIYQAAMDGAAEELSTLVPAAREVARLQRLWDQAGDLWDAEHPDSEQGWDDMPEEVIYEYTKRVDAGQ